MEKIQVGILTTKAGGLECTGVVRWYEDGIRKAVDFIAKDSKTIIFDNEVPIEAVMEVQESLATLLEE